MKFQISAQELNYLINKIQNVVPLKPASPILSNFLIEAANDELVLTATDLTVTIRCSTEAKILEEGATTLPAKRFGQLMRELSAPLIELSTNADEITTLVAGSSRFKFNGMRQSEYPELADLSQGHSFYIKQKELKHLLYQTAFAVSREDNRYVLTGLFMDISPGKLSLIGTDGKKLAKASSSSLESKEPFAGNAIVPIKAVDEFLKNLSSDDEMAQVTLIDQKIVLSANHTQIVSKLLTGEYPDVERVIPEHSPVVVSLHREELISLLRQVSLFVEETNHAVRLTFGQGELKLAANARDFGEGHAAMPINYYGNELEIAFNPSFFIEVLRHCEKETVTIGLSDSFNPGIIIDGEPISHLPDASPLFILMPMRLFDE